MRRVFAAKFIMVFYVMTIACTISWDVCIVGTLYNCTDPGLDDYLTPGLWLGDNWPVKIVPTVVPDGNINDPDTLKEGWSKNRLLVLWFIFFATSIGVSAGIASRRWPTDASPA